MSSEQHNEKLTIITELIQEFTDDAGVTFRVIKYHSDGKHWLFRKSAGGTFVSVRECKADEFNNAKAENLRDKLAKALKSCTVDGNLTYKETTGRYSMDANEWEILRETIKEVLKGKDDLDGWKLAWVKKDDMLHDNIAASNNVIQEKDARIKSLEEALFKFAQADDAGLEIGIFSFEGVRELLGKKYGYEHH